MKTKNNKKTPIKVNEPKKVVKQGLVVAAKLPKTVTVLVKRKKTHLLYQKSFARSKKYLVHDEIGVSLGDVVDLIQIRPISKNKHFQVAKVVGKNMETIIEEQIKEDTAKAIEEMLPGENKEEPSETESRIKKEEPSIIESVGKRAIKKETTNNKKEKKPSN